MLALTAARSADARFLTVIKTLRIEAWCGGNRNIPQRKQKGQAVSDFILPDLTYSFASVSSLNEDLEAILYNMKYL